MIWKNNAATGLSRLPTDADGACPYRNIVLDNIKNSDMRFMSLATSLPKKTADNKSAVF